MPPGVEAAHVSCAGALREDALLILRGVGGEGVGRVDLAMTADIPSRIAWKMPGRVARRRAGVVSAGSRGTPGATAGTSARRAHWRGSAAASGSLRRHAPFKRPGPRCAERLVRLKQPGFNKEMRSMTQCAAEAMQCGIISVIC